MPLISESVGQRLRRAAIAGLLAGGLPLTAASPQEAAWPHACDLLREAGADGRLDAAAEVTTHLELESDKLRVTSCSLGKGAEVATLMVWRDLSGKIEGAPAALLKAHAESVNARLAPEKKLTFEPLPALGAGAAWTPSLNQITLFKEDGSLLTLGLTGPRARPAAIEILNAVLTRLQ